MSNPIRVLLVDDEEAFVASMEKVLRKRGMEVHPAYDGRSALDLLDREAFDVVVLDVRMPGMDGLAALKEIRQRDPATSVILLSGHIDFERTAKALKDGATEILLKPCPIETLVTAIENAHEWTVIRREATDQNKA